MFIYSAEGNKEVSQNEERWMRDSVYGKFCIVSTVFSYFGLLSKVPVMEHMCLYHRLYGLYSGHSLS